MREVNMEVLTWRMVDEHPEFRLLGDCMIYVTGHLKPEDLAELRDVCRAIVLRLCNMFTLNLPQSKEDSRDNVDSMILLVGAEVRVVIHDAHPTVGKLVLRRMEALLDEQYMSLPLLPTPEEEKRAARGSRGKADT